MADSSPRPWALGLVLAAGLAVLGCDDPTAELDSSDTRQVIDALRECGKTEDEEVAARVAEVVSHEDTMVAAEAVRSLGRMRNRRAVQVLRDVAAGTKDKRSALRQEAVIQLGWQREAKEEALPILREVIKVDPDPRVRAAAATSIEHQRSLVDVALLVEVAENETDPIVQGRAVGAVERLVGLKFGYDPTASKDERQKALERMRRLATVAAAAMKQHRESRGGG
jgi:HEAT repeat protein